MTKVKMIRTHTAEELTKALGLTPAEGVEMVFRADLNARIIKIVKKKRITHAQLATLIGSSRTRMTALLNKNIGGISTDLMLRVLSALGYTPRLKITKSA